MNCDSGKVLSTLEQIIYTQSCAGLLLDFQKPDSRVLYDIAKELRDGKRGVGGFGAKGKMMRM